MEERDNKGRFCKGHAPSNQGKGGPPKGLQQRCREATRDGADIVELMLQALRGSMSYTIPERTIDGVAKPEQQIIEAVKPEHRMEAAQWFADRGWGKATQFVEQMNGGEIVVRVVRVAGTAKGDRAPDSQ